MGSGASEPTWLFNGEVQKMSKVTSIGRAVALFHRLTALLHAVLLCSMAGETVRKLCF